MPAPAHTSGPSTASSSSTGSKLEPFLLLAQSTKPRGAAAAKLVQQVTEASGVYVFGELFNVPGIAELASSEEHVPSYRLLQLFAYGTLADRSSAHPTLSDAQLAKLRQLTLVTLAARTRALSYDTLFSALEIPNAQVRDLEDLIIEATYAGLISGKLNQVKRRFEVDSVIGRDVQGDDHVDSLLIQLQEWSNTTQNVLQGLEERIQNIQAAEMDSNNTRQAHNEALLASLQQVQDAIRSGAPNRPSADTMDIDSDEVSARTGPRKKGGSSASTQRNKRSRA